MMGALGRRAAVAAAARNPAATQARTLGFSTRVTSRTASNARHEVTAYVFTIGTHCHDSSCTTKKSAPRKAAKRERVSARTAYAMAAAVTPPKSAMTMRCPRSVGWSTRHTRPSR